MKRKEKFSGGKVVASCLVILFIGVGAISTFGVFLPQIATSTGFSVRAVALIGTFSGVAAFITNLFIGKAIQLLGAKSSCVIGAMAIPLHFAIFSISTQLWMLYLAAAIAGVGLALLIAPVSIIITNWYIEKRAAMIGIVFSGMAYGGLLLLPLTGYLISKYEWRTTYQILALIMAVVILTVGMIFIKDNPEKLGQKPLGYDQQLENLNLNNSEMAGVDASVARKSLSHWLIYIGIVLLGFLISGFMGFAPSLWATQGMEATTAANYMGIFSVLGGIGGIIGGVLAGKLGTKFFIIYSCIAFIGGAFLLIATSIKPAIIILALVLIGLAYPLNSIVPSFTTMDAFGKKDYDKLLGPFQGANQLGGALIYPIIGAIFDATNSFKPAYTLLGVASALALLLILFGLAVAPIKKQKLGYCHTTFSCDCHQK
jgi:OFA family oxalate/formate antiporter-like MFS transporter